MGRKRVRMKRIVFYVGLDASETENATDYKQSQTRHYIARTFGGYSDWEVAGGWIDPRTNQLVSEPAWCIEVYAHDDTTLIAFTVDYLRSLFCQESILVVKQLVDSISFVGEKEKKEVA